MIKKKQDHVSAGDSPKVRLTPIRGPRWLFKVSDCRGPPPLRAWHLGVQIWQVHQHEDMSWVFQERGSWVGGTQLFPLRETGTKARKPRGCSQNKARHLSDCAGCQVASTEIDDGCHKHRRTPSYRPEPWPAPPPPSGQMFLRNYSVRFFPVIHTIQGILACYMPPLRFAREIIYLDSLHARSRFRERVEGEE